MPRKSFCIIHRKNSRGVFVISWQVNYTWGLETKNDLFNIKTSRTNDAKMSSSIIKTLNTELKLQIIH